MNEFNFESENKFWEAIKNCGILKPSSAIWQRFLSKITCDKDKIDIVPFGTNVIDTWSTTSGFTKEDLFNKIKNQPLSGSTALYPAAIKALELLSKEDADKYVSSVILMTDGMANEGSYRDLELTYTRINRQIPIYSIMFGSASKYELEDIAELTNAKVFDGKTDLVRAFKEVRGYN